MAAFNRIASERSLEHAFALMQSELCRLWHADVLEWVWFLNSHPEAVYGTMYGDKDTFPLAFHLARKGDIYNQIPTPPGAVLDATPEDVSSRPPPTIAFCTTCALMSVMLPAMPVC